MPLPIHIEITLANLAAIGGLVFGVAGLVLSITNYLRDRAKLVVDLRWDMTLRDATGAEEEVGVVTVSNVGRRPIYISHTALRMPKGAPHSHLLIMDSVKGEKLGEGDAPRIYTVKQSDLTEYRKILETDPCSSK